MILDIVHNMGCDVKVKRDEVNIKGYGNLQGLDVELKNAPDLLPNSSCPGCHGRRHHPGSVEWSMPGIRKQTASIPAPANFQNWVYL